MSVRHASGQLCPTDLPAGEVEGAAPAVFEVDGAGDGAAEDAAVPEAFHAEEAQGGEPVVVAVLSVPVDQSIV